MPDQFIPDYQSVTKPNPRRVRKRFAWSLGILVVCIAGLLWPGLISPWLSHWTQDVDLTTGRIRTQRFVLYIKVREIIMDSVITNALDPSDYAGKKPDWRRVCIARPEMHYRYEPGRHFYRGNNQTLRLSWYWRDFEFTPAAQRESAKRLLQAWQTGGRSAADDYLRVLRDAAMTNTPPVDVSNLPK